MVLSRVRVRRPHGRGDLMYHAKLTAALADFKAAAEKLSEAWEDIPMDVSDYPDYLPSFDEFVVDIQQMEFHAEGNIG